MPRHHSTKQFAVVPPTPHHLDAVAAPLASVKQRFPRGPGLQQAPIHQAKQRPPEHYTRFAYSNCHLVPGIKCSYKRAALEALYETSKHADLPPALGNEFEPAVDRCDQ
jgi:hypothetical protein